MNTTVAETGDGFSITVAGCTEADARHIKAYMSRGGSLLLRHDGTVGWLPADLSAQVSLTADRVVARCGAVKAVRPRADARVPTADEGEDYEIVPDRTPACRRVRT